MEFLSREIAGQQLGRWLNDKGIRVDVVLGLPRGGVIVAAEVARCLRCPLDVIVVRKIGHPLFSEFAVGALAEPDVVILDEASVGKGVEPKLLEEVVKEERQRLSDYQLKFHQAGAIDLKQKVTLLVDDGLATGATMEAGVLGARKQGATKVVVAVPVSSVGAIRRLKRTADEVHVPFIDPDFAAVGQYYTEFPQTSDEEVQALLAEFHLGRDESV